MTSSGGRPSRALATLSVLVLVAGMALMVLHIGRYPPDFSRLSFASAAVEFQWAKLVEMARVLGWLFLMNLASWSLGSPVERLLRCPSNGREFQPLYRLGFGFAVLSILELSLAALHALTPAAVHLTILIPAAATAVSWIRRRRHDALELASRLRVPWLGLAAGLLCFSSFLGAFFPEPAWDAATYHLGIPERYLFANGIVVTPFSHLTAYPFMAEMLFIPALVLGGPSLAALIHFEFGVLLLCLVGLAARRFSSLAAVLAPAILLADPLFQNELSWAYNDLTLAFYALLAITAFAEWASTSEPGFLRYAGVLCGISVLVKIQGALVAILLVLMLWLSSKRTLRDKALGSLVLFSLVLLVCSPWLARNLVFTGNPVAPLFQSLFYPAGGEYFDRTAIEQSTEFLSRIGMGKGLDDLLALPWNLVMRTVPGFYRNSFGYQVTPLYVIGALGALAVAVVRRNRDIAPFLGAGGVLTLFWFFSFQEARFLLPALSCFAVAGGAALSTFATAIPRWGMLLLALPLTGLLYAQALSLNALPTRFGYALGNLSPEEFRTRHPTHAAAAELRRILGPRDRLLLVAEGRGFTFSGLDYIPYHINEGPHVLQLIHRNADLDSLHCALRELGVTHVLVNLEQLRFYTPVFVPSYRAEDYERDVALLKLLAEKRTRTVYARDGIWTGALLDPPGCPP